MYDLVLTRLAELGLLTDLVELEPSVDKADLLEQLQSMLDPEQDIIPLIAAKIAESPPPRVVFVTGIGEVFPYVRSHTVLNNLHKAVANVPVLSWFPGTYEQSPSGGSNLSLFGRVQNDQYYRARDIRFQEA